MSEEKPLDATFFAFKKRDRSFVLTSAAIAYYLMLTLLTVVFIALTWNAWAAIIAWYVSVFGTMSAGGAPSAPDPQIFLAIAPYSLASLPISLLVFAMFEAACLRWMVRGEAGGGLFGLKLDGDTWRVFAVYWLWVALFVLALILLGVCYALLIALGNIGGVARIAAMLMGALAPLGFIALLLWAAVSFAPAAATSVGRQKLTFVSARKVSGPRYWPLFTAYFLVIVGYVVIATIVSAIFQIPLNTAMAPIMAAAIGGAESAQVMTLVRETFLTPTMIAILVANLAFSFVLATVYYVAMFGVNARAFEAAVEAGDVERAPQ